MLRNGGRTSASGTYRGAEGKSASYTLAMSYDNMHRIKSKSQHLTQQGVQFDGTLNAGYDLTYTYQDSLGHKFQLSKVEDLNYRTEGTPNEKIDNGHRYLYDADPRRIPYAGTEADGVSVDYQTKYNRQQQAIKDNYADFGVPYNGEDNNDYVNGEGFCCNDGIPTVARAKAARSTEGNFKPNDDYEKMQFYYHPDHLGSSSYITNLDGEVVQHIEYVPFGEVFIEERNNTWNTPYLFNVKEYDEETGMYYYGARYYEPRISLWMSVDPRSEEAPEVSSYVYAHNSPTSRVDLDGKWDIKVSASSNRAQHPYAVYAVYDRKGNLIYKTVVKVLGSRRKRNQTNADTPQGLYKILEWRKTGTKRYPQISFGPNDLLALEYQGGEGGSRQGMHTHGGRRQQPDLMGTHGCMRIADADIKELKEIVTMLEQNDPKEKMGFLTLTDDLQTPVSFKDRERIKEEVYPNMLPEVVVVGHKPQKSEKSETKNEGTKDEVH